MAYDLWHGRALCVTLWFVSIPIFTDCLCVSVCVDYVIKITESHNPNDTNDNEMRKNGFGFDLTYEL
jgi:hypothetical protein